MNKVILQGNLARDMEIRYTAEGMAIARGSMALDRGKDQNGESRGADFPSIVAFGKRAEFFEKFGTKGRRYLIEGHLQTGSYEKDGNKVYTTDVIVDRVEFADSKPADNSTAPASSQNPAFDGFSAIDAEITEELPFN